MTKKYPSCKITTFAVYHKFSVFGGPARTLAVAFPSRNMAEKWIDDKVASDRFCKKDDYMVEEMDCRMKAWQP